MSLPMWERGLKLELVAEAELPNVAPHVGAWIETRATSPMSRCPSVAPQWERGLKCRT